MNGLTLMPLTSSEMRPKADRFNGVITGATLDNHAVRRAPVMERRQRRRSRQSRH